MAWTPLRSSGADFEFEAIDSFAAVSLSPGSVVVGSSVGGSPGSWTLAFPDPVAIRITVQGYSDNSISDPAFFTWQPGSVHVVNANPGPEPTSFLPVQFEVGPTTSLSFQFGFVEQAGSFQFLIEVQADPEPAMAQCDEIGVVSRAFASAHDRTRIHQISVPPGERRCVVADFNGALPAGRSIASADWRLSSQGVVSMSDAAIPTTRQAQVQIQVGYPGRVALRCVATLDNGEVYVQRFMVEVPPMPFFGDETVQAGPLVLSAVAG